MKYYYLLFLLYCIGSLAYGQKKPDEPTSYTDDFTITWKAGTENYRLLATSKSLAPIEITITDRKTETEIRSVLLPAQDSVTVLEVQGSDLDVVKEQVSDSVRIGYFIGHPDLIHPDLDYAYRMPFQQGKKYKLNQGFNGKTSHNSDISRYALDFNLKVGDTIYAARPGVVIKVVDWFTKQGGPELRHAANRIVVMHEDGTLAGYVHLIYQGSLVKVGDRVAQGQKIGIVGLTGFTTGHHVHFVVRKERNLAIPVYFMGYKGRELKVGKRYRVK